MRLQSVVFLSLGVVSSFLISSCNTDRKPTDNEPQELKTHVVDSTSAINAEFEGKIFSIPSPVQTAILLKQASGSFNAELINPAENADKYSTTYSRALNLGVYGADLGYATLFGQQKESMNYLKALQTLADGLSIAGAFDKSFAERFERNMNQQDSLLIIVQDAYRTGDKFLKNNKQKDISSLILAGGWIESMYFACQLNTLQPNPQIIERIGEQKQSLETLLSILSGYNTDNMNDALLNDLNEINDLFKEVQFSYTFREPVTDASNHIITLNHDSSVIMSDELVAAITEKISALRNNIIG